MLTINEQTILNAIIGYPLKHTLSPKLHSKIYRQMGINAVMLAFPQQNLAAIIRAIRTLPIHLIAVTMPHKRAIMCFLDHIDKIARLIGAVNTVINRKGKLYGFNTDVAGIAEALKKIPIKNKKVLLIGAGGAARPVAYYINHKGGKLMCLNRTIAKAKALVDKFGGRTIMGNQLKNQKFDIIINTIPVGMAPHKNQSPIKSSILNSSQTVFDIIYNPEETKLLKMARHAGAKTISGIVMFQFQALEQVKIWQKTGQVLNLCKL